MLIDPYYDGYVAFFTDVFARTWTQYLEDPEFTLFQRGAVSACVEYNCKRVFEDGRVLNASELLGFMS